MTTSCQPIRFPLYDVLVFPTSDCLPADWQLLSESTFFSEPFVLQWRVERAETFNLAILNAEDALRQSTGNSEEPDRSDDESDGAVHHFEVRIAGPDMPDAVVLRADGTECDLAGAWDALPDGILRYDIVALDAEGIQTGFSNVHHFVKGRHPINDLQFPDTQLAPGAKTGVIEWPEVACAMLRHIRPFTVRPHIRDTDVARRTTKWRAQITHASGCETIEHADPELDAGPIWNQVAVGPCQLRILGLNKDDEIIALSPDITFKKGPDHTHPTSRNPQPASSDLAETVRRIANYLATARSPEAYNPESPIWHWHSSVNEWGNVSGSSFPSQFEVGVEALLLCRRWAESAGDESLRSLAAREARGMVEFILDHRFPKDWTLAGLPGTTLTRGRIGGHAEGDMASLPGIATIARTFVWMHEESREQQFLDAAHEAADRLLPYQNEDGSWPWRVQAESGEPDVRASYTSQIIEFVRLYRLLSDKEPNPAYRQAADRGLEWILNHPVRTQRWEGYYIDDPGGMALNSAVSHLDAVWTARYLCAHGEENPDFLSVAQEIESWVENHFVIYGRETHWGNSSIVSTEPVTPAVIEKPFYQRTVTGHTANWMGLLLDLHRATGAEAYKEKADAACAAIHAAVLPQGAVIPESPDRLLRRRPHGESLWFWNAWAVMKGLLEFLHSSSGGAITPAAK